MHTSKASGAYIFRPLTNTLEDAGAVTASQLSTSLFTETLLTYENLDWGSVIIRSFVDAPDEVEIEWMVGPIPGMIAVIVEMVIDPLGLFFAGYLMVYDFALGHQP